MSNLVITGAVAALSAGFLFHIVLPGVLGVLLAITVSGLSTLDPLYAGDRIKSTWTLLGTVLIIQVLHTFISATVAGGVVASLASRLPSMWLYPVGALLSAGLHYILFFAFAFGLSIVILAARSSGQVWTISLVIATIVAPIIGLISTFAVRQWGA